MVDTREYLKETQDMSVKYEYSYEFEEHRQRTSLKDAYLLLGLVLFPNGLLRERLRLAEGLVQCDDALSEM